MPKTNADLLKSAHAAAGKLYQVTGNVELAEQTLAEFRTAGETDDDLPQWQAFVTQTVASLKQQSLTPAPSERAKTAAAQKSAAAAAKPINTVPGNGPVVPAPAP